MVKKQETEDTSTVATFVEAWKAQSEQLTHIVKKSRVAAAEEAPCTGDALTNTLMPNRADWPATCDYTTLSAVGRDPTSTSGP